MPKQARKSAAKSTKAEVLPDSSVTEAEVVQAEVETPVEQATEAADGTEVDIEASDAAATEAEDETKDETESQSEDHVAVEDNSEAEAEAAEAEAKAKAEAEAEAAEAEAKAKAEAEAEAAEAEAKAKAEAEAAEAASAAVKIVTLGSIECRAHLANLSDVLDCLDEASLDRVGIMRPALSTQRLAKRLLLSEGRGTPIVFTEVDDATKPCLFMGHDQIAAAIEAGIEKVVVLTAKNEDAAGLQSYLVSKMAKPTGESDEDVMFFVNQFYGD